MNETISRIIVSLLVIGSMYPLLFLTRKIIKELLEEHDSTGIKFALLATYITFLGSSLMTLYINYKVLFMGFTPVDFLDLAILRNLLKSIGIFIVSWSLYIITCRGGAK